MADTGPSVASTASASAVTASAGIGPTHTGWVWAGCVRIATPQTPCEVRTAANQRGQSTGSGGIFVARTAFVAMTLSRTGSASRYPPAASRNEPASSKKSTCIPRR